MWLLMAQLYSMAWNAHTAPTDAIIGNSFHWHYFLACLAPLFPLQFAIGPSLLSPIFCQALVFAGLAAAVLITPLRVIGRARQIQMTCGAHLLLPHNKLWRHDLKVQNNYMKSLQR